MDSKKARTAKLWRSHIKKLIQAAAIQNRMDLPPSDWRISGLSCMQRNANFQCDEYIDGGFRWKLTLGIPHGGGISAPEAQLASRRSAMRRLSQDTE